MGTGLMAFFASKKAINPVPIGLPVGPIAS